MPFQEQIERNQAILTSIREKGLMPKQTVSIGAIQSQDHADVLCFNLVDLNKVSDTKAIAESLTYESSAGLWPIAMEGTDIQAKEEKFHQDLFNNAIQNSVVFIFNVSQELESKAVRKKSIMDDKITTMELSRESYFYEMRVRSAIASKDIVAILVPTHLESQVANCFRGIPLITVDDCATTMKQYPFMLDVIDPNKKPSFSDMWNSLDAHENVNMQLTGPDYVEALRSFITTFPDQKKFGIHLARLATPAMLKKNSLSVTVFKEAEEKSAQTMTIEYRHFAAQKEALHLKKYSLSPLSKKQLNELEQNPHLTILKDSAKRNGFFVICDAKYASILSGITAEHKAHPFHAAGKGEKTPSRSAVIPAETKTAQP